MIDGGLIIRLLALGVNITLGIVAYRRNPRNATHVLLFALTIFILLWGIANELSIAAQTVRATLIWIRLVMFFAVPLTVTYFLLMYTFPKVSFVLTKMQLQLVTFVSLLAMGTAISPYLFTHIAEGVGSSAKPVAGPGMIVFLTTAVLAIVFGFILLVRKNFTLQGLPRLQARYLLAGTTVMFALILGLIFVPVVLNGDSTYVAYSVLFILPFIVATTYSIVRYRLMDIRLAIFRALSLSFLVSAVLFIYLVLLIFAVPVVAETIRVRNEFVSAAAALISIPLARWIQKGLTRITDRYLYQKKANYARELKTRSQQLSSTILIQDVVETVLSVMKDVVRSRKVIILMREQNGKDYITIAKRGIKEFSAKIPEDHFLVEHLKNMREPIVRDELALMIEQDKSEVHKEALRRVKGSLNWLNASLVIPLFVNKNLNGIIILGDRLSGEPYLQQDVDFLASFSPQIATALDNARLYKESLEFGEKLKSEVKRATYELKAANEQLRDLDKTKSEFLSIASHQLYTPLTAIRGYLSMLKEGDYGKMDGKQEPIINILENSSNRLIDLIKNLLDISRIESGRLELNLESIDLAQLAGELVEDLLPNAMRKKLELEFVKPKNGLPHVVADRERIRQVMLNFVDNAIKYTSEGSIKVKIKQEQEELVFSVSDTGRGISAEGLSKLFNKFSRVDGSARLHTEGTGLGLYVAKQIVQEHKGNVRATSNGLDQGSTFTMRLPIEGSHNSLKAGETTSVVIKATD